MKNILFIAFIAFISACNTEVATGKFGAAFENKNALPLTNALNSYNIGKDTTYAIFGTIENVCQHKGCWISLKNGNEEFYINNDETFKMPKTSKGHKATAIGKFVKDKDSVVSFLTTGVVIE